MSLQATVAGAYVSQNPLSVYDVTGSAVGNQTASYGLLQFSGEAIVAWRPTQRFAIEPRVGGGVTWITPPLTDPVNASVSLPTWAPHVVGGVDFKYLTLLTDFTAGLGLTGTYVFGPNILGISASALFRYTF